MALLALFCTACAGGGDSATTCIPLEWQAVPQESGAGDTLAAVRLIRRTLGSSPAPIVEAYARLSLGRREFLVVRAESTHGTGFYQSAYYVFTDRGNAQEVVLTALADERNSPNRVLGVQAYHISGCLTVAGRDALAYRVEYSDPTQGSADTVAIRLPGALTARASGIYRWSESSSAFTLRARKPAAGATMCGAAHPTWGTISWTSISPEISASAGRAKWTRTMDDDDRFACENTIIGAIGDEAIVGHEIPCAFSTAEGRARCGDAPPPCANATSDTKLQWIVLES
jgi:hypothetical protein